LDLVCLSAVCLLEVTAVASVDHPVVYPLVDTAANYLYLLEATAAAVATAVAAASALGFLSAAATAVPSARTTPKALALSAPTAAKTSRTESLLSAVEVVEEPLLVMVDTEVVAPPSI
jgi:hypothetical protein